MAGFVAIMVLVRSQVGTIGTVIAYLEFAPERVEELKYM